MNPALLVQLVNTAAQLILLVNELKSGAVSDAQAWSTVSSDFDVALAKWDAAMAGQKVLSVAASPKPDATLKTYPVAS